MTMKSVQSIQGNRCEKCDLNGDPECESGKLVPRGCHKRNIYWIDIERTIAVKQAHISELEQDLFNMNKNHNSNTESVLNKLWEERAKVSQLQKELT